MAFIWTMVPKLEFKDTSSDQSLGQFLELHKAPVLESLCIHLGEKDVIDVKELVSNSVNRFMRKIELDILWTPEPTTLPKSLYTSKTVVELTLSNNILIDVPSSACLPSLKILYLILVAFKDEDSLKNLVSSCSLLARSEVGIYICNRWRNPFPVMNRIRINPANVPSILVFCNTDDKCGKVSSLVTTLFLALKDPMVLHFSDIAFPRLQRLALHPFGHLWLDLLLMMLNNSPKLNLLCIDSVNGYPEHHPFSWIQPDVVPRCLSSHLEKFRWKGYRGKEQEKQVMRYILDNSKCLKKAIIISISTLDPEEKEMMIKDLESMSRVSTSELLFK